MRRVIEGIWILVIPKGRVRLAAVQVWFTGDGCRDYLIYYRAAGNRLKAQWEVRSFATAGLPDGLDLRRRGDAAELQGMLAALDLGGLAAESIAEDES